MTRFPILWYTSPARRSHHVQQGASTTKWPNWVDICIVTLTLLTAYNGFIRGVLTELLSCAGLISATAAACNYHRVLAARAFWWMPGAPYLRDVVSFLLIFLVLVLFVSFAVRRLNKFIAWEQHHWLPKTVGLLIGGIRGAWWSGLLLLMLLATGVVYFKQSIDERSLVSPYVVKTIRHNIEWVADRFPGHEGHEDLLPLLRQARPQTPPVTRAERQTQVRHAVDP